MVGESAVQPFSINMSAPSSSGVGFVVATCTSKCWARRASGRPATINVVSYDPPIYRLLYLESLVVSLSDIFSRSIFGSCAIILENVVFIGYRLKTAVSTNVARQLSSPRYVDILRGFSRSEMGLSSSPLRRRCMPILPRVPSTSTSFPSPGCPFA